jgi:hypothetical protein
MNSKFETATGLTVAETNKEIGHAVVSATKSSGSQIRIGHAAVVAKPSPRLNRIGHAG